MLAWIHELVGSINGVLWGKVLVVLLVGAGLYFSVLTRVVQVRLFAHTIGLIKHSRNGGGLEHGVSSFQALATSLAARVGTGNLAGVAIAISVGGPGAVFWMWVTALVGMATAFIESTLGQVYKVAGENPGQFRGGPAYYIERGLKQRWLGIIFAICLLIAFGFAFNAAQANTIADALQTSLGWDTKWVGIGLVLLIAPIIFSGIHRVGQVSEVIVPLMALGYILIGLFVVITHIADVPAALLVIYKSAFGLDQVAGGVFGGLAAAMLNGIKRGLFSNEAGMGSAPNIAAAATTVPKHPAVQGFMQMFGVFVDTLVICTVTAVIIILAGPEFYNPGSDDVQGITLTQNALSTFVGDWGVHYITIALFFFAFTSVLGNYSYGESNIAYIAGRRNANIAIIVFRCCVLGVVYLGSVADLSTVWDYADLAMGMMALINLVAILLLGSLALRVLKDYERQIKTKGIMDLSFNPANFPIIGRGVDPKAWPVLDKDD
ncbi:alanine:cation symporter family protein [Cardiobacteriaceae bacterium TAE3-ERU3]|nr:alanine:cation symporter family protein [Cardiobacteriaceae bacterium TAE3-ERU3]